MKMIGLTCSKNKAQTEPILNQSIFQSHKRSEMKYITYLVMCLVMLLAAPVVWAGQVGHTVDMPEYMPSVALEFSPVVAADCRDVFASNQPLFIYKSTSSHSSPFNL